MTHTTDGIEVTGVIAENAHLGFTAGDPPNAVLTFEIHPDKGMPYRVRKVLGTDPSVHMQASTEVHALRRGTTVAVQAKGLRVQADHGHAALVMLDVQAIHPLTHRIPHSQES